MHRLAALFAAALLIASVASPVAAAKPTKVVTVASYYGGADGTGFAAMIDYCSHSTGIGTVVNTYDSDSFQENIVAYLEDRPDTIFTWSAGERMAFYANQGLLRPINDVWAKVGSNYTGWMKAASTAADGNKYLIPIGGYPWVVIYRKSVFAEKGYAVPTTLTGFVSLATKMQADGLVPLAFGNADGWEAMGTFDILDMRMNGYQFHKHLMAGKAKWTDSRVKAVFQQWIRLLPYFQTDPLNRTWQGGAESLFDGTAGMYFLGTFAIDATSDQAMRDDLAMFPFPLFGNRWDAENAIDGPIDGLALSANGTNQGGARKLLACVATGQAQLKFVTSSQAYVAAAKNADTSGYTPYQRQAAQIINSSNRVAQFLDRDSRPDFSVSPGGLRALIADFLTNPNQDLDAYLASIQSLWDSL